MRRATWMLAGAVTLLLAGCGQKGALYLPDKNAQVVTTPAASSPPPAQSAPPPPTPATVAPPKPTDENDDSQAPK
jgi:predicted small lipoprotein YifL